MDPHLRFSSDWMEDFFFFFNSPVLYVTLLKQDWGPVRRALQRLSCPLVITLECLTGKLLNVPVQTETCVFFLRLRTPLQFLTAQCYWGAPVLYSICVWLLYMNATPVYISHTCEGITRCHFLDFFYDLYRTYAQCQICRETLWHVRVDADARLAGCPTGGQESSL